jgi:hypothetical protein
MRELILYTLAVAYLVLGGVTILMLIGLLFLWIRHWFHMFFPNYRQQMLRKKRERLIDDFMRTFD